MNVEGYPLDEAIDWRDKSACLDEDPELFFPVGSSSRADLKKIEDARAVCGKCSVRAVCLEWALENGQDFGIWGGLTEEERRALKRRRNHRSSA